MFTSIGSLAGLFHNLPFHIKFAPTKNIIFLGQTSNTSAGSVANQGIGTVALPAVASGAKGQVTITDSKITALSIIQLSLAYGTTTPATGASPVVSAEVPTAGSCVLDIRNPGATATLSTDYVVNYWSIN